MSFAMPLPPSLLYPTLLLLGRNFDGKFIVDRAGKVTVPMNDVTVAKEIEAMLQRPFSSPATTARNSAEGVRGSGSIAQEL